MRGPVTALPRGPDFHSVALSLTTVTNLQENQEKFHGFSTFTLFFVIFVVSLLNKIWYGTPVSLWSSREPIKICIYTIPQTLLAQLTKTVKPTLK